MLASKCYATNLALAKQVYPTVLKGFVVLWTSKQVNKAILHLMRSGRVNYIQGHMRMPDLDLDCDLTIEFPKNFHAFTPAQSGISLWSSLITQWVLRGNVQCKLRSRKEGKNYLPNCDNFHQLDFKILLNLAKFPLNCGNWVAHKMMLLLVLNFEKRLFFLRFMVYDKFAQKNLQRTLTLHLKPPPMSAKLSNYYY